MSIHGSHGHPLEVNQVQAGAGKRTSVCRPETHTPAKACPVSNKLKHHGRMRRSEGVRGMGKNGEGEREREAELRKRGRNYSKGCRSYYMRQLKVLRGRPEKWRRLPRGVKVVRALRRSTPPTTRVAVATSRQPPVHAQPCCARRTAAAECAINTMSFKPAAMQPRHHHLPKSPKQMFNGIWRYATRHATIQKRHPATPTPIPYRAMPDVG